MTCAATCWSTSATQATGVFVVDDTGFVKKGVRSAGVPRQYTGTSGKIDNCQIGVFLAYATSQGRALIDRELYLPTVVDRGPRPLRGRRESPTRSGFATKPQLGIAMLERAHAAGQCLTGSWVTADEAYGQNPTFRAWLAAHEVPYVLATRNDDMLASPDGHRRQAKVLATLAGSRRGRAAGNGAAIGPGAHGERDYDWTAVALDPAGLPDGWGHWLLVRRQTRPGRGQDSTGSWRSTAAPAPPTTPLRS